VTTTAEAITWATHKAELEAWLGVESGAESTFLEAWLDDATAAADQYIGREFIPISARWNLKDGIKSGDDFTIKVTPDESSEQTAQYVATGDVSPAVVAYALREALAQALSGDAVTVEGAGAVVRVVSDDPDVPFGYSAVYTASTGTSGILETVKYDGLPGRVKRGVFEYVKAVRQLKNQVTGLKEEKVAAVTHKFDEKSAAQLAFLTARDYWRRFKADILNG
jgi:hypothetical protein